ncbi:MAG: hypothetical protein AAF805_07445, partial [Planctomycetota bacterium]
QDLELEVSHQLGDAIRDLDLNYATTETNFNRRAAAQREVDAVRASYEADRATLNLLLEAQRRRSEAETAYYRSLVDYNLAVIDVHFRKGSLLDYDGVYLAEGPWPGKAYFDAMRRARKRDAALYLDYGFTRPNVMSRGPHAQRMQHGAATGVSAPTPAVMGDGVPEGVELIQPEPMGAPLSESSGSPSTVGRMLFAAPGDEAAIDAGYALAGDDGSVAVGGLGYEAAAPAGAGGVATVAAFGDAGGGVTLATGTREATFQATHAIDERQTDHASDRPAAAPSIGAR